MNICEPELHAAFVLLVELFCARGQHAHFAPLTVYAFHDPPLRGQQSVTELCVNDSTTFVITGEPTRSSLTFKMQESLELDERPQRLLLDDHVSLLTIG